MGRIIRSRNAYILSKKESTPSSDANNVHIDFNNPFPLLDWMSEDIRSQSDEIMRIIDNA